VKIIPLTDTFRPFNRVERKDDAEGGAQEQGHSKKNQKDPQEGPARGSFSDNLDGQEKVKQALSAFSSDTQALANGLTASVTGSGPGLKVILRDGTGAVIRQFTGEEFLRMREAASQDGRNRGKILDQKL
jgi:hypothetical protein